MLLFLPETSRVLVDNGSFPATGIHRTLYSLLVRPKSVTHPGVNSAKRKISFSNPLKSLYIIFFKDTASIMLVHSVFYLAYGCTQASMSSLFIEIYDFSELNAGLIYLPMGFACVLMSYLSGEHCLVQEEILPH